MSAPTAEPAPPGPLMVLVRLALPVFWEQVLHMLVGFSDTMLTGHYLGTAHLAAVSSMTYVLWFLTELFVFVAMGSTAVVARSVGARNWQQARHATNQSYLLGGLAAVVLTALMLLFGEELVALLQLEPEAHRLAVEYLFWVIPTLPAIMLETVGVACLRGAGDTRGGLWVMLAVVIVNIIVSWVLVGGWGPIPAFGWAGIAIGTAVGHTVGGLLVLVFYLGNRSGLGADLALLRFNPQLSWRILRIGVPGGVDIMLIVGCQFWFLALVNGLGVLAAAAHGVAIRIESLAYLPGTAFQVAAATMVGQALGAADPARARRSVVVAAQTGLIFMVAVGVTLFFGGPTLAQLFVGQQGDVPAVAELAGLLLQIVAFALPGLALTMILNGALRGAGDTRWPVIFNLIGFLAVRMPLTYLMAYELGWGVTGAWYAMLIDLCSRCFLSLGRFWQGGWQRINV